MSKTLTCAIIVLFLTSMFTQADEPLWGISYGQSFDSDISFSNQIASNPISIETEELSAFYNIGFDVAPNTIFFHSLRWYNLTHSTGISQNDRDSLPDYLYAFPNLNSFDISTGLRVGLSDSWQLTGLGSALLSTGSGDQEVNSEFYYTGTVLISRAWGKNSEIGIGGYYNTASDNSPVLPIVYGMINYKRWELDMVMPLYLNAYYNLNSRLRLGLAGEFLQSSYRYKDKSNPPIDSDYAKELNIDKVDLGLTADYMLVKGLRLSLETGFTYLEYNLLSNSDTESKIKMKNGMQLTLGLTYMYD